MKTYAIIDSRIGAIELACSSTKFLYTGHFIHTIYIHIYMWPLTEFTVACLPTVPSDPVQNVMASNDTDNSTIAVVISWDPPACPNGVIRRYRIIFQQTEELFYSSGSGNNSNIGCPAINTTIIEQIISTTTESSTAITLYNLGQYVIYHALYIYKPYIGIF